MSKETKRNEVCSRTRRADSLRLSLSRSLSKPSVRPSSTIRQRQISITCWLRLFAVGIRGPGADRSYRLLAHNREDHVGLLEAKPRGSAQFRSTDRRPILLLTSLLSITASRSSELYPLLTKVTAVNNNLLPNTSTLAKHQVDRRPSRTT